jgi:hypothetical protein
VPFHERYVRASEPIEPTLLERLESDCRKLSVALGYDFNTLEFAVRDGIPYAIDFLNPAPDADPNSVGQENFEWVLERAANWLVERVQRAAEAPVRFHWQQFLAPQFAPKKTPTRRAATRRAPTARPRGQA